jgi:hypothetical protein
MTVSTSTSKSGPYAGAGATGPFPVGFYFLENTHLRVIKADASGTEVPLALSTDYSVTGAGLPSGGTVTTVAPVAVGESLTILRDVPLTQETDYTQSDSFPAESHERALDKLTMGLQQVDELAERAIAFPASESVTTELPKASSRANRVLGFDSSGNPVLLTRSDDGGSALALDLQDSSDPTKGPGMLGFGPLTEYGPGTSGYALQSRGLSVRDFWESGDADWAPATRRALDAAAANIGSTYGGQVFFPPGVYDIPTTVYIPRTNNMPLKIYGHGAVIRGAGAGVGTIFETGQGTASTGASSNFGTDEVYLHYNTQIEGLQFENCGTALKLNNFLQGCVVRNCGAVVGVQRLVWARRCFYLNVLNNSVLTSYDPAVAADTDACFRFEDNNNGMVIQGNSALRSVNTKGSGFYFAQGCSGVVFTGNTAERCGKGLVIRGQVYNMLVEGNFFEANGKDLSIEDANYKDGLRVDANWFYSAVAIEAVSWRSGELGKSNHYEGSGSVTINNSLGPEGALNSLNVWLPRQVLDEAASRTTPVLPSNWLLNGSVIVHRQTTTYLNASGPSVARSILSERAIGGSMIAEHKWIGEPGLRRFYSNGGLPFCTVTNNTNPGPGTLVVDTQIAWTSDDTGARFDFVITDTITTYRISGLVSGTTVFRDDVLANTCVASINSGKLRLTLGNFTMGDIAGGVRIV